MKQFFTLLVTVLTFSAFTFAQETFVLDNFENGLVNFTDVVNGNPPAHFDYAVVDNPVKAGINTSNKVWEWKRFDAEADNKIWAGFYATLKTEIPKGYHRIEVKYLRKNSTSQLKIKCEGAVSKEIAPVNAASKTNEWETLVFDIYANGIKNIKVFSMFPDFYEPIDASAIVYIDDIKIIYDPTIVPPPAPTSISFFTNSASNLFHDQSWVNQTSPSTVNAVLWSDPTQPGDKLPVVTTPVKDGANALKLQWKSVPTGDWMALVAAIGWVPADLSQMTHLKFWVNSPVTIAKADLPKLRFEATSGNPNNTGKVLMGNYLTSDLAANTWTEVSIPLADIWAADPAFLSKDVVKGIFFSQNTTDNVEHTMFIDEIKFEKVTPALVLFSNSSDDRFHDQSWTNVTAPSTLAGVLWSDPTQPGDKLPVVTTPVKDGANALKLQWKSTEGGSWMALVAAVGWTSFDLTPMTHLSFWVNSPVRINRELLPNIYLESHSGNPNKTGKLPMGNYVISLAANTWTEVRIPLADLYATNPAFTAKDVVKGIFFEQRVVDATERTMYMDEFKFIALPASAANASMFIDFGENNPALMMEGNWNNVTDHQAANTKLIDESGNATGITLAVTDPFYNGYNSSGTSVPTGNAAIFSGNAGADNFFGNGAVWGTTAANPEGIITFSGLNPAKFYSFKIFASRTGVTNIRDARYTMTGLGADVSDTLNASNNTSRIAEISNVKPTAEGVIVFKTEAGPNNNSAEKFYFLGAMKISVSDAPTSVFTPKSTETINAMYNNGVLKLSDYTGLVRVYGLAGNLVAEKQVVFGYAQMQLNKGIYIVNTAEGNAKLFVK
ncbi:MAG: hypothetical protein EOM47_02250 [Bacteroidia bacterium]|nr:hypothetical protein [Bacteroidia bacterium]